MLRRNWGLLQDYIGRLLNHTNQYTGIALKHEPAILGWETGNELNGVPAAWTAEIAAYIKAELGAQQLVLDGIDSERLGGVAHLAPDELTADHVDLYTDHFYPPKPAMVVASAAAALAAGKVYYVGECVFLGGVHFLPCLSPAHIHQRHCRRAHPSARCFALIDATLVVS